MKELHYSVSPDIFQRFPGYVRGVVIAHDVTNRPSSDDLIGMLRDAEESVRSRLSVEQLAEHPRIKSWRDAYRAFGAKPSEFRASVEALARRVLRKEPLPSINALLDIGNLVSLPHLLPAGGHAIDVLTGDIALRFATGISARLRAPAIVQRRESGGYGELYGPHGKGSVTLLTMPTIDDQLDRIFPSYSPGDVGLSS